MNSFICLSLNPIELADPGLAVATSRAGGVGVLDLEFCANFPGDSSTAPDPETTISSLDKLLELVNPDQAVGLRLPAEQMATYQTWLSRLSSRPHWLIICRWHPQTIKQAIACLPPCPSRQLLLEVTDSDQILALSPHLQAVNGIVAKGHESGGWVGTDSAFLLTQKLVGKQPLPVYVQGGIGIHTVAACRAAGAAGVVLDDQLWLMPESPLPQSWQRYLNNLNGQEAIAIGERLSSQCRVLSRPGFPAIAALQQLATQLEIQDEPATLLTNPAAPIQQTWQQKAQALMGWGTPGTLAWPMGQAVGLAVQFRDRYQTTGKFVQALLKSSLDHIKIAQTLQPLQADSPLAISHRTTYPIVQGPMTRVSDSAEFADAVSQAGALPLLALALMQGKQVRELLLQTKTLLGERSWGIGILGFVPQAMRDEQLKEVIALKPPFALIAGGRPDQAAELEAEGIATYLHVPVPNLLKMFLEQGSRRFVFEGRECGGHVGPLSSFLLWESMISTLLDWGIGNSVSPLGISGNSALSTSSYPPTPNSQLPTPHCAEDIHILFAGGIHDARSAAMVSAMAAPLVERGMRVGVLMGSAYLFTEEAVACGAIVKGFQEQAIACTRTINLETGPGHANRCAVTPFAQEFYATRRQLLQKGTPPDEIKKALENLTLGRLRVATKGLVRQGSEINPVNQDQQIHDGMYMIGQVATLRSQVCTIKSLHEDVAGGSTKLLNHQSLVISQEPKIVEKPSDIAIIGISTLVPQAQYQETFWENILKKLDPITEIPPSRWDWRLYYDPDRTVRDKVYSKWGGFLDDVPFDPLSFGIPPKSLKSIEPVQLLTLEAVRRALDDAGLAAGNFDREMTSVILGAGGGIADLGTQYATRSEIPRFVESPSDQVWQRLPEWTEETFPGLLLNVIAGRVANRFDLGGSNFTVDAACASSLAAIDLAVKELESGRSNIVIAGGVDTVQSPFAYLCFSKTQALSPRGKSRTFDKSADGIVISEGIAIVVLKRLADAERDGDRIYAVIKSVAGSSDGKALGMTAPLPAGQMRAVKRAYNKAGVSPKTIGLYEAHGTGTVAGDRAELETMITTLTADHATSKTCAIGSIKSMIGHTKSTAGVVGLIKTALSLHHKTLPPHAGVENPLDPIADPESPVYLLKEAQPWLANPENPRRAAVSAFGFGGTNFHAVLEEYAGNLRETTPGDQTWPYELFVFKAENQKTLIKDAEFLLRSLQAGAEPKLKDLAYSYAKLAESSGTQDVCLSLVVENLQQLQEALNLVLTQLKTGDWGLGTGDWVLGTKNNILYSSSLSTPVKAQVLTNNKQQTTNNKLAFLFPGQGAQYPDMGREVALYFQEMRSALELANQQLRHRFPKLLSQFIYPPSAYSDAEQTRNQQQLTDTHIAQPAIGTLEAGYLDLVTRLGLKADMVAGHSYGEYTALHAAGVLSRAAFLKLSEARGRVMSTACAAADGAMAAVQATREELLARLDGLGGVVIANHNAPLQSVISGEKQAVRQVVDSLNVAEIMARMLPVAGAFHSSLVASAQVSLSGAIASAPMQLPKIPVYANSTARPYQSQVDAIRTQLSKHLLSPVEFVGQINAMYDDGARIFLEVGPKSILTKLVGQILAGKNHTVVSLDGQGGGMRGLLLALGKLAVKGVDIKLTALFAGRDVQPLDLSKLVELTRKPQLPATTWLVNGGGIRPISEAIGYTGQLPPLNVETSTQQEKQELAIGNHKEFLPTPNSSRDVPAERLYQNPNSPLPTPPSPLNKPMSTPTPETGASQPVVPATSVTNYQPAVSTDAALIAYQAYQQTMRQFLSLQEKVMQQFLSGGQMGQMVSSSNATPVPMISQPQPTLTNGKHNGNGVPPHPVPVPTYQSNGKQNGNGVVKTPAPIPTSTTVVPAPHACPRVGIAPQLPTQHTALSTQHLDKASLTQTLLNLVSDRTGYPTEMLGLDQDMEAELGIDSIKRVEILGALQKTLPSSLATAVKSKMESLTRVKSLNGIVEQLLANLSTAAPTPNSQLPTPNSQLSTQHLETASLTQTLLNLVSDRTGYPTEMLGLDQDMEAELGIDSIKRVEILGSLQKTLPEPLATSVKSKMDSLTCVKSLNGIVEQLQSLPLTQEDNRLGKLTNGKSPLGAT